MMQPLEVTLRYAHSLGALSPYFAALERGEALATHCAACGRNWCPPRFACTCGGEASSWCTLPGSATVVAVTHGPARLPLTDVRGDLAFGLVALDGAANRMFARLASPSIVAGTRVRLVRADLTAAHSAQRALFVALDNSLSA